MLVSAAASSSSARVPGTDIPITANGNVQHSTAQNKIGASSIYFDGTGDALTADFSAFAFGTGDYTVEYWSYLTSLYNWITIASTTRSSNGWNCGTDANGMAVWYTNGPGRILESAASTYTTNTWYHTAYVNNSGTLKVYVGGVEKDSATSAIDYNKTALSLGALDNSGEYITGYLDEIRISNVARYTSGFTPSLTAFTTDANTILLIHSNTTNGSTTFVGNTGV